ERMLKDELLSRLGAAPVYVVDADAAKTRFGYVLTGGMTAAMRRKSTSGYRDILRDAKRIIVLEDVENPNNVGAIFRSAAAFGVDAVILSPACVDPLYRRAMRVSMGNAMLVPWAYAGRDEADWKVNGVKWLKELGFTTVAMALRDDNITIDDALIKKADKIALIMGNEGEGLASSTIDACDYVAKIPMLNGVDSLNVAVAAGVAMWEMTRK
ncbi:MAG: RNA methyltransferase, partial [Mogibacterium sp.]|nr:RNA methyltransferase [Mogibacterium sp.]